MARGAKRRVVVPGGIDVGPPGSSPTSYTPPARRRRVSSGSSDTVAPPALTTRTSKVTVAPRLTRSGETASGAPSTTTAGAWTMTGSPAASVESVVSNAAPLSLPETWIETSYVESTRPVGIVRVAHRIVCVAPAPMATAPAGCATTVRRPSPNESVVAAVSTLIVAPPVFRRSVRSAYVPPRESVAGTSDPATYESTASDTTRTVGSTRGAAVGSATASPATVPAIDASTVSVPRTEKGAAVSSTRAVRDVPAGTFMGRSDDASTIHVATPGRNVSATLSMVAACVPGLEMVTRTVSVLPRTRTGGTASPTIRTASTRTLLAGSRHVAVSGAPQASIPVRSMTGWYAAGTMSGSSRAGTKPSVTVAPAPTTVAVSSDAAYACVPSVKRSVVPVPSVTDVALVLRTGTVNATLVPTTTSTGEGGESHTMAGGGAKTIGTLPVAVPDTLASETVEVPGVVAARMVARATPEASVRTCTPGAASRSAFATPPRLGVTVTGVPAATTLPQASVRGAVVTSEVCRPSAVIVSRETLAVIVPAGAAGATVTALLAPDCAGTPDVSTRTV